MKGFLGGVNAELTPAVSVRVLRGKVGIFYFGGSVAFLEKVRSSPTYIQGSGLQKNHSQRPNSFPKYPNFLVSGLPDLELSRVRL